MREHHRVDEADAPGEPGRDRKRKGAEQARPEEVQARRRQRQIEALEQPQRQQRLHDEAAGKGVDAEQRREPVDDTAGRPERRFGAFVAWLWSRGSAAVEKRRQQSERGIEIEHRLDGGELRPAVRREQLRQGRRQRADGRRQRADQAVAGKDRGAVAVGGLLVSNACSSGTSMPRSPPDGLMLPMKATSSTSAKVSPPEKPGR